MTSNTTPEKVMHTLEEHREDLVARVTQRLIESVPVVGISQHDSDPEVHHHHNMALTAERFHEIVQAGATIDWTLVSSEFRWADRKLGTMGITHAHHGMLIDTYFTEAHAVHTWSTEERAILDRIADSLREAVKEGYQQLIAPHQGGPVGTG